MRRHISQQLAQFRPHVQWTSQPGVASRFAAVPGRACHIAFRLYSTADSSKSTPNKNNPLGQPIQHEELRNPRSAQAIHLKPLRRTSEHGIPSCDLQLRSYSIQPLEFFSDFALRAAYYLGLPAFGPVPLPRITERWTVPRDHFIFKKSQENFERRTLRRMIQIQDGNPETVQLWLAYLRKHQYYGIGMKANFWEFGSAELGSPEQSLENNTSELLSTWQHLGQARSVTDEEAEEMLSRGRLGDSLGVPRAMSRAIAPPAL
ncbi:hypothetical protein V2A60_007051 [Cordyceps javanica]|uniref:Small ribosomal subunit protein uS10m n=1 Tax=Cordyceps javanica TaxID=43265 RepID=A0A545USC2_9HYPO|nr:30S ribosomal protein S10 [Cordyceps javanica]TQW04394.1 30S ribosomal protein S10 [Cordyceps javanica]